MWKLRLREYAQAYTKYTVEPAWELVSLIPELLSLRGYFKIYLFLLRESSTLYWVWPNLSEPFKVGQPHRLSCFTATPSASPQEDCF